MSWLRRDAYSALVGEACANSACSGRCSGWVEDAREEDSEVDEDDGVVVAGFERYGVLGGCECGAWDIVWFVYVMAVHSLF